MGDFVAVCIVYYVMPFPVLLLFVKRECVHSVHLVGFLSHFTDISEFGILSTINVWLSRMQWQILYLCTLGSTTIDTFDGERQ